MALTRIAPVFAAALVMLTVGQTSPAHAQVMDGWQPVKSVAILGGQSRLAEMLSQQQAAPRPIQPSSYGIVRATSSVPGLVRVTSPVSTDRPDVFGTVALKVKRTSLDEKWLKVERARIGGRAAAYASSLRRANESERLASINRYVNKRVKFTDDSRQYRRADVWTTANQTLRRGRGDCEDYAIAKLQMLRAAGFSDANLYLVILKDLVRRTDHAVAVVRSGEEMLVLDNGTDEILESGDVVDYRPVFTFAANGAWTHGYKLGRRSIEIASADIAHVEPVRASQRN